MPWGQMAHVQNLTWQETEQEISEEELHFFRTNPFEGNQPRTTRTALSFPRVVASGSYHHLEGPKLLKIFHLLTPLMRTKILAHELLGGKP